MSLPCNTPRLLRWSLALTLLHAATLAVVAAHLRALLDAGTWVDDAGRYAYSDLPWLCTSLDTDAERAEALAALRRR
jgi:hypothetical protein